MSTGKHWTVSGFDSTGQAMMIMAEIFPWFSLEEATNYVRSKYPTFQWPSEGWIEDHRLIIDINYSYPLEKELESKEFWYYQNSYENNDLNNMKSKEE